MLNLDELEFIGPSVIREVKSLVANEWIGGSGAEGWRLLLLFREIVGSVVAWLVREGRGGLAKVGSETDGGSGDETNFAAGEEVDRIAFLVALRCFAASLVKSPSCSVVTGEGNS